ncbi:MAG TPA: hypothetical protein VJN96_22960 [Vicinamibacterales bacterium]|nr:hypothetical protein [Vicinamibacterales bacterium]
MRRVVGITALVVGLGALAVAVCLLIAGSVDLTTFHIPLRAHDPWRPALVAVVALVVAVIAAGGAAARDWIATVDRVDDRVVASALAAITCAAGIAYATTVAGAADPYGYVSQADRWLEGQLKIPQPWAQQAPWPSSQWSFSTLGYRPGMTDADAWSLVPIYSPGLPMIMAAAKAIGGQEGMFWVVPVFGGLLVLATFGVGRRLGASRAGLIGAFLVATSPAVLFNFMDPATDVAVAGAWMVSFYFLLGESRWSALAAGLACGIAILIRPNNAFEAGVLGLWYILRAWRTGEWRREIQRALLFAIGVAPGIAAVAAIYSYLYGSPFVSGYGTFAEAFQRVNILPNASRYPVWFIYAHTPVALAGLVALAVPLKVFWPAVKDRIVFVVIGVFVSLLVLEFLAYLVFDTWWTLRFVIPCLPFIMIGIGAVALAVVNAVPRAVRPAAVLVALGLVVALGARDLRVAVKEGAFDLWRQERRYVAAAQFTRRLTAETSVVYCMQHSGSLRYYAGRLTVRYDQIDRDWLDRSLAWFQAQGVHPYLLLEDWEIPDFKAHFAGAQALALLDEAPLVSYNGGGRIQLFDLGPANERPAGRLTVVETFADRLRSVAPAPFPRVAFAR